VAGQLVQAALQERPLGVVAGQRDRLVVGGAGLAGAAEPGEQVGPGRGQQVVAREVELVDGRERRRGSVDLGDGDGPVERGGSRSGNSVSTGTRYGMAASRIFFSARKRAISGTSSPPSRRRASAVWAGADPGAPSRQQRVPRDPDPPDRTRHRETRIAHRATRTAGILVAMTDTPARPESTDVLVIGAGPAGSAAAAWAARNRLDVVLADAEVFPRDKACGDGLTPRAIAELDKLGLGDWVRARGTNRGLRAHGFGQVLELPWPGGSLPDHGGAVPRTELDARIRDVALKDGAIPVEGAKAVDVVRESDRVTGVVFADGTTIGCRRLVVADGARSTLGRVLGRVWHQDTAFGVAARGYVRSARSDDPWISSHLELRGEQDEVLAGYGWVFPLADGEVNIGVGTLATERRPANIRLRSLIAHYANARRADWALDGEVRAVRSALLPMGGAVSGVAGRNWAFVGDAAGCVNPLNGEGIDYGLETGRLAADLLTSERDLTRAWPQILHAHYGQAFSIARRLAGLLTLPRLLPVAGPVGMRSRRLMTVALRVMGNLVTDEDRDLTARAWRAAGRLSLRRDERPPFGVARGR
jgi:geranylgeranyl reductase family protein